MKLKLFWLSMLIVCTAFFAYSQKININYSRLPYYKMPVNDDYVNYESYGLYVYFPSAPRYDVAGFYQPYTLDKLKKDTINGDFKIIVEYQSLTKAGFSTKSDSTLITAEDVTANITVYDKAGKLFYDKPYRTGIVSAGIKGDYKGKVDDNIKSELVRSLIDKTLPLLLTNFSSQYLVGIAQDDESFVPVGTSWALNPKGITADIMTNADEISAAKTPDKVQEVAKKQLAFWDELSKLPDEKDNRNSLYCGLYNSALLYYILGDEAKSDEYFEKALTRSGSFQKSMNGNFVKFKAKITPSAFNYPDLTSAKVIHQASMKPIKDMKTTIYDYKYLVLSGVVTMKDNSTYTGNCLISRKSEDEINNKGNIVSFSGSDYLVVIETSAGEKKEVKLANIANIKTDDALYYCEKSNIYKVEYKSNKVGLYREVFPRDTESYKYQLGEDKLKSPSLFGTTSGWLKKFFKDCPDLSEKVGKKEMENPLEIVKYYDLQCK